MIGSPRATPVDASGTPWGTDRAAATAVEFRAPVGALDPSEVRAHGDRFHGQAHLVHPVLIRVIDALFRGLDVALAVSTAPGAVARDFGPVDSPHYVGDLERPYRLSTAVDLLVPEGALTLVYHVARAMRRVGGIGLYPDLPCGPGIHLDIRRRAPDGGLAQWVCRRDPASGARIYRPVHEGRLYGSPTAPPGRLANPGR